MRSLTPETLDQLAAALAQATANTRVAGGGTDLVIQLRQGRADPDLLIYPGRIPQLRELRLTEESLHIGAMVTMAQLAAALEEVPELRAIADAAAGVGTPQIRNKATMAGNLCNASPAGDMLPIGLLYGLELEVLSGDGTREAIPMDRFILGPGKNALRPGQAVVGLTIPRTPWAGWVSAFQKIGFREHVSIARESIGALVKFAPDGTVQDARLTLGAVSTAPIRVPEAEAAMTGRKLDQALFHQVAALVAQTVHNNCRPANRLYKTEAAKGLTADLLARLSRT